MKARYLLETAAVYAAYGFFRLLPLDAASALGGRIGRWLGPRFGLTRIARANLAAAFPDKSAAEIERILMGMWDNLGRTSAEVAHLRRIWERVTLEGGEWLDKTRETKTAAIYCAAHLANWEVCAIAAQRHGVPIHLVYRKPNNAGVDSLLRHARDAGAAGHIEKGVGGAREMVALLRQGAAIGILADQRLSEGIPVPFFGRNAMTAPALAHFALKFGCPIYPTRIERLYDDSGAWRGGCHFKMTIHPAMPVPQTADKDAAAREMMTDFNARLESWVRERPEQWLWIHRRWA